MSVILGEKKNWEIFGNKNGPQMGFKIWRALKTLKYEELLQVPNIWHQSINEQKYLTGGFCFFSLYDKSYKGTYLVHSCIA